MTTLTADLTDETDGVKVIFPTPAYLEGSLEVHLNGVRLREGYMTTEDFIENPSLTSFEMAEAPNAEDTLSIQFETDTGTFDVVLSGRLNC